MRLLKYHERKLLKKVDFVKWTKDDTLRENEILRRYLVQDRADYIAYNRMCGRVRRLAALLAKLPPSDAFRIKLTAQLVDKLYNLGLLPQRKNLNGVERLSASAFCRRRLPVVMVKVKMAEHLREAVQLIEQGHVRVGPETVVDPAYLVPRAMEDFIAWTDRSKIRRKVHAYNDKLDDFDLL